MPAAFLGFLVAPFEWLTPFLGFSVSTKVSVSIRKYFTFLVNCKILFSTFAFEKLSKFQRCNVG